MRLEGECVHVCERVCYCVHTCVCLCVCVYARLRICMCLYAVHSRMSHMR
jgi:hypothetical protein